MKTFQKYGLILQYEYRVAVKLYSKYNVYKELFGVAVLFNSKSKMNEENAKDKVKYDHLVLLYLGF